VKGRSGSALAVGDHSGLVEARGRWEDAGVVNARPTSRRISLALFVQRSASLVHADISPL